MATPAIPGSAPSWTPLLAMPRSEEHTSELSHRCISYAVFCLKKKNEQEGRPRSRGAGEVGDEAGGREDNEAPGHGHACLTLLTLYAQQHGGSQPLRAVGGDQGG